MRNSLRMNLMVRMVCFMVDGVNLMVRMVCFMVIGMNFMVSRMNFVVSGMNLMVNGVILITMNLVMFLMNCLMGSMIEDPVADVMGRGGDSHMMSSHRSRSRNSNQGNRGNMS